MASGRLLNRSYSEDRLVAELIDEHGGDAAAIYFGLIPYQDREGRLHGDPAVIKGRCWPRSKRVTTEIIAAALQACHEKQLLIWYEHDGERFICFPNFRKNQPKAKLEREAESTIPDPPADMLANWRKPRMQTLAAAGPAHADASKRMRTHADGTHTQPEWNGMEEKGTEQKAAPLSVKPLPLNRNTDVDPVSAWRPGQPIRSPADFALALSHWRWTVHPTEHVGVLKRIIAGGQIEPFEIDRFRPKSEGKGDPVAYMLGAIEKNRQTQAAEAAKPSAPGARAPPAGPVYKFYDEQQQPED